MPRPTRGAELSSSESYMEPKTLVAAYGTTGTEPLLPSLPHKPSDAHGTTPFAHVPHAKQPWAPMPGMHDEREMDALVVAVTIFALVTCRLPFYPHLCLVHCMLMATPYVHVDDGYYVSCLGSGLGLLMLITRSTALHAGCSFCVLWWCGILWGNCW